MLPKGRGRLVRNRPLPLGRKCKCTFQLYNVLFLDKFAEDFGKLGELAKRDVLDAGLAGKDRHFWLQVHDDFVSSKFQEYGILHFIEDDIFLENDHIDPSKIVAHDSKKLQFLRKRLNSDDKSALSRASYRMYDLIQDNIRKLRIDLSNPSLAPEIKADILSDISGWTNKKNEIGDSLGLKD